MSSSNLMRWGGCAAIMAGLLRGVNSFLPTSSTSVAIELLYLLTDILIIFGMIGLYGFQHQESQLWGFWGFLLAIVGIAVIRTRVMAGVDTYTIGAFIFVVGLSLLAIGSWLANKLPRWVSACWVLSTVIGVIGSFVPGFNLLLEISGVLFGISFAGAGLKVWSIDQ